MYYYCSPPIPRNYTLHKCFSTQLQDPINHHLAFVLDHFSPVISSIPADLPFFNFLTLSISSSLLITSSPKYLFLLVHISEPTRLLSISYAVFCLKKKKRS